MADIRKPRRADYMTGMATPNTGDAGTNTLFAQLQENINALAARLAEADARITALERRKPDETTTETTRRVEGGSAEIGKNVRNLGAYTTPGGSKNAAADDHQHACVSYVADYVADLTTDLGVSVPATAYVRSEKRYYKWVKWAWVPELNSDASAISVIGQTKSAGTSETAARADHVHTGTAVWSRYSGS